MVDALIRIQKWLVYTKYELELYEIVMSNFNLFGQHCLTYDRHLVHQIVHYLIPSQIAQSFRILTSNILLGHSISSE